MTSKSILVVSDLSFSHGAVVAAGLDLARRHHAQLHVIHPVPTDHPVAFRSAERVSVFDALRKQARNAGVDAFTVWQQGEPAEIVTEYANARVVDLVIVGAERRTGFGRLRARTLAERVAAKAKQPTLVLPAHDRGVPVSFERAVVAVDRIATSGALVALATEIFGASVRAVTVVHAVDNLTAPHAVHTPARWLVPEFRDHVLTEVRRELDAALEPYLARSVDTQLTTTAGPAFDAILSAARDGHADVIVVGGAGRFLRARSVTSRLVRRAGQPLLVIPETALWSHTSRLLRTGKRVA